MRACAHGAALWPAGAAICFALGLGTHSRIRGSFAAEFGGASQVGTITVALIFLPRADGLLHGGRRFSAILLMALGADISRGGEQRVAGDFRSPSAALIKVIPLFGFLAPPRHCSPRVACA